MLLAPLCENDRDMMRVSSPIAAILTDSHFLIPLAVFCIGLTLLIALR